jgi:hypothetical protein
MDFDTPKLIPDIFSTLTNVHKDKSELSASCIRGRRQPTAQMLAKLQKQALLHWVTVNTKL